MIRNCPPGLATPSRTRPTPSSSAPPQPGNSLPSTGPAVGRFDELVVADGFQHVPINHYHCLKAGGYAVEHRDPFDRMLAAQTELEGLVLVTRDPALGLFGVATFW